MKLSKLGRAFVHRLDNVTTGTNAVGCVFMAIMAVVVIVNVFGRFLLGIPLKGVVELVEVMMVQPLVDRLEMTLELGEVHHPAEVRVDRATDVQLDAERVPVNPRALVPGRYVGQAVRALEREGLEDFHGRPAGLRSGWECRGKPARATCPTDETYSREASCA